MTCIPSAAMRRMPVTVDAPGPGIGQTAGTPHAGSDTAGAQESPGPETRLEAAKRECAQRSPEVCLGDEGKSSMISRVLAEENPGATRQHLSCAFVKVDIPDAMVSQMAYRRRGIRLGGARRRPILPSMGHPLWPLYDLRLRTPELELRLPTEDELVELCAVARAGVHDPDFMPFQVPWTRKPSPQFEREFIQHHWEQRATWSPERWRLGLAVFHDGQPMGCQDLAAESFPLLREVHTGSWLGKRFQGRGFGKQMRAAALHLAFAGLGAVAAHSGAYTGNHASLGVSRALGYEPNGVRRVVVDGEVREEIRLRLLRERWETHRYCDVEVSGLSRCRELFGTGEAG